MINVQDKFQIDGYSKILRSHEKLCMTILEETLHKDHLFWK